MSWLDEQESPRQTREQDRPEPEYIDLDHRELTRQTDSDVAGLASVARSAGPRDLDAIRREAAAIGTALGRILDAKGEGTRAYYRWQVKNKDGTKSTIEGPTVDLMDALAGAWGRLLYTIKLVEETGQRVHLRGRVLDLVAVVAHERDYVGHLRAPPGKFQGEEAERWKVMQLQSAESKAIRGVLEHVIPAWVVEIAMEAAHDAATNERLGKLKLAEAVEAALKVFGPKGLNVPWPILRQWAGDSPAWTAITIGELRDLRNRLKRGELTPDGLAAEAAEREAARKMDEAPTAAGSTDRLESLGLGGAQQTAAVGGSGGPPAQPPPTSAPAPEGGASASPGTGAGASPPTGRAPNASRDAQDIRDAIGLTRVITLDRARVALRTAAGLARVGDARFDAAVDFGSASNWWVRSETGLQAPPQSSGPAPLSGEELRAAIQQAEEALPDPEAADRVYADVIGEGERTDENGRRYLDALIRASRA